MEAKIYKVCETEEQARTETRLMNKNVQMQKAELQMADIRYIQNGKTIVRLVK